MKRTHKFSALSDVAATVAAAPSLNAAAATLGVARTTLYRWIKAGKIAAPGAARVASGDVAESAVTPARNPDEWAASVRASYTLTETELQLLDLAKTALTLAYESGRAEVRLSAIGRYQTIVKQLGLDNEPATPAVPAKPQRERSIRVAGDPRALLTAVK